MHVIAQWHADIIWNQIKRFSKNCFLIKHLLTQLTAVTPTTSRFVSPVLSSAKATSVILSLLHCHFTMCFLLLKILYENSVPYSVHETALMQSLFRCHIARHLWKLLKGNGYSWWKENSCLKFLMVLYFFIVINWQMLLGSYNSDPLYVCLSIDFCHYERLGNR